MADKYRGRSVKLVKLKDVDSHLGKSFFLSSRNFNIKTGVTSEGTLTLFDKTYGSVSHYPSNMSFFTQEDGTLLFDPARDSSLNQVSINYGTSFAIGNLCH